MTRHNVESVRSAADSFSTIALTVKGSKNTTWTVAQVSGEQIALVAYPFVTPHVTRSHRMTP